MHATATRPGQHIIVLAIPEATVELLQLGEIAAILLQLAVIEAAAADRADAMMAEQRELRG